jgi:protein-S-isoprenylcysteine O-methyltransferase Ste14
VRDLVALELMAAGAVKLILTFYLWRHERVKRGRWWPWPPTRGVKMAGTFCSTAVLLLVLGSLIMGGTGPLPWWTILVTTPVVVFTVALWIDWAQATMQEASNVNSDRGVDSGGRGGGGAAGGGTPGVGIL